ncbi:MAG TPA: hypothetical protein VGS20_09730 [Candidatus Acidoferrales bacterium]|nr:hypothetical protein [Candidatus Acidoferrales bacterium]
MQRIRTGMERRNIRWLAPVLLAAAGWLHAQSAIPSGTPITVTLDQSVSSKTAHAGDRIPATVAESVAVDGHVIVPRGAKADLLVASAQPSGRLSHPARLYLRLESIEANGRSYPVESDLVGRSGPSHKGHDVKTIGGGSAAGAIIGAIAGGGKGAAIGAAAGAGAGTAVGAATGKKDIAYPVEARLRFRLKAPLRVR